MPGRSASPTVYRYGFNGQEKVDEINNIASSHNTAMFWEYDARLGRRWNMDPKPHPSISDYATFANSPIWFNDPLGDTTVINIFSKDDPEEKKDFYERAEKMVLNPDNTDGVFIIAGHADPEHYENNSGEYKTSLYSAEDVFNLLEQNEDWNTAKASGVPITLILAGCNTATEPEDYFPKKRAITEPLAQRVSAADVEITVVGANGYCMYGPIYKKDENTIATRGSGLSYLSKKGVKLDQYGNKKVTDRNGQWIKYQGGKKKPVAWAPDSY